MNLQTMEYFSVLARERSFTRAAEALHITQQSLSGHIAAVEQELGAQLVVRFPPHRPAMRPRSIKTPAPAIRRGPELFYCQDSVPAADSRERYSAGESVFQQVELAALPEWSVRITRPFSPTASVKGAPSSAVKKICTHGTGSSMDA